MRAYLYLLCPSLLEAWRLACVVPWICKDPVVPAVLRIILGRNKLTVNVDGDAGGSRRLKEDLIIPYLLVVTWTCGPAFGRKVKLGNSTADLHGFHSIYRTWGSHCEWLLDSNTTAFGLTNVHLLSSV